MVLTDQQPSAKVSYYENLHQLGNESTSKVKAYIVLHNHAFHTIHLM